MKIKNLLKNLCNLVLVTATFSSVALAQTSVWKVSKGEDYLYIGGTVHLLPPTEFPLPASFERAYADSDVLVLETRLPDQSDTESQMAMMQAFSYTDGKTLNAVLSPAVYQQLATYLAGYQIPLAQLNGFRPGFIMMQIVALEAQRARMAGEGVDMFFAQKAVADNKPQAYLESLQTQLDLIANLGQGYEDAFIQMNLEQTENFVAQFNAMLAAWRTGDSMLLDKLVIVPAREADERIYQALFLERNKNWVPQIEQMFGNEQRELVLVGVGHLVGESSVLEMLQQAGYQIEQLANE